MTRARPTFPGANTQVKGPPKVLAPDFAGMPDELKQLKNWLMWRSMPPKSSGGKSRKVPYQPHGKSAKTNDPSTWNDYELCRATYYRGGYAGIGFAFDGKTRSDGLCYCGIDFDNCIRNNKLDPRVERWIRRIASYTEISVSGTGLHSIVLVDPASVRSSKGSSAEVYTKDRYFTFTGQQIFGDGRIKEATAAVRELVDEIRSEQQGQARTETPRVRKNGIETPAFLDQPSESLSGGIHTTGSWFNALPDIQKDEIVDHAMSAIASNSPLLELTDNGGNNAEYYRLTTALARSGAPHAKEIFIKYASKAKDADSEEELDAYFDRCREADHGGITVATLLYIAEEHGANFDPWKRNANDGDPNVVQFLPGNEEECRQKLDRVVADDPRTYTLGDPGGPLVILRVPDPDTLPPEVKWESDLPGTTLAAPADIMRRAERLSWMKPSSKGAMYRIHPPRDFIGDYLIQMRGQYGARPLLGIVRVPRINDAGNIHFISGYDPRTGLFHDNSPAFEVPENPSRDDAISAVEFLLSPFSEYKFEEPAAGRPLVLAANFTAIERPFLPVAPMFVVRSSIPATGKGKLVRSIACLAFDTKPVVITWGGNDEEFEKRLAALLLRAPAALMIDNANGKQIQGDLLESILTEGCADIRPLGQSVIVKIRSRTFINLTGNNPIITGDMARRSIPIDILPASADPETERYAFDPVELICDRRTEFLQAAFTAMRAFRLAGMPSANLPAIGSFDHWTRKVRDAVYWLTSYDVSKCFQQNKAEDPRRQGDAALLAALHKNFGSNWFKAAEAVAVCERSSWTDKQGELRDALGDVLGSRGVNAQGMGYWARRIKGAPIGGLILETEHDPATNAKVIRVRQQ
jgi:hypothetical protein